jgi:hypothetical protein
MADLSKFGVPLDGENLGILHPKQQYRFRVKFFNFGLNDSIREMTQNVMTVTRPKISHTEVELHAYNSIGYIAGKHAWEPVTITLRDDINNAVISAVGAQLQKQMNHFEQTSAVAGVNYKFSMEIDSLDGTTNEELETWRCDGCFLQNVSYPDGDYSVSEPNMVELTVRYDVATNLTGPNNNGGNTVGDDPFIDLPSPTGGATFG